MTNKPAEHAQRHTWTVRIDRRKANPQTLSQHLRALAQEIQDLHVEIIDMQVFWSLPDDGTFRDFTPIATLSHPHTDALEHAAELLLDDWGWGVDFVPQDLLNAPSGQETPC